MANQADFDRFLSNIEPSDSTVTYISSVQNNLRGYLRNHMSYKDVYVDSFLSGSYSKHTSIRPAKGDKKRDVDIIVVTKHDNRDDSRTVLKELYDVLIENTAYKTAERQHHSIGVELSQISIDIVPVIVDEYDFSLYYVCNSSNGAWEKTDPKGHKEWSTLINQNNNNVYKPLVKVFKWWRRIHCPKDVKYPKGITLETIIANNLGDSSQSTEDLFIETMGKIVSSYKDDYADKGLVPYIDDPSDKIVGNNLLDGYGGKDFSQFIYKLIEHLDLLNTGGTENDTWRKVLGDAFPANEGRSSQYAFDLCSKATHRQKPVWPMSHGGVAFVSVRVTDQDGREVDYQSNGNPLDKGCSLCFIALTSVKRPFIVKWQITNTGAEAQRANCLRGNFEDSDNGAMGKKESTSYAGSHSVQCYIIKDGVCVAKSRDFTVNIK